MKILRSLFLLFLVVCLSSAGSYGKEEIPSLKFFVSKLESDIQNHRSQKVIRKDVEEILKAKEELPVNYVPELNYLLKKKVEDLPDTEITELKNVVKIILPVEVGAKILVFLICFYSFVLFFQTAGLNVWLKRLATLLSAFALAVSVFSKTTHVLLSLLGADSLVLYRLKKKSFLGALIVSGVLIYSAEVVQNCSLSLVKSPQFLYSLKIKRDGYAPPFLIEEALGRGKRATLEEVTCNLSFGELGSVEKIKKIHFSSPELKAVKFNDLGYVEFLRKNYKRALAYFEKANSFSGSRSYQILYNLYLTHSALLDVEKADTFRKELEERYNFTGAPPTPLLVHVPAGSEVKINFQLSLIASALLGVLLGLVLVKTTGQSFGFEGGLLFIPGMRAFVNGKWQVFIAVSVAGMILNALAGMLSCRV